MATIIKAIVDGEEREFKLLMQENTNATHYISGDGDIREYTRYSNGEIQSRGDRFGRLCLIRKQHTFGGVVFEEVEGLPVKGEFYTHHGSCEIALTDGLMSGTRLRPVRD